MDPFRNVNGYYPPHQPYGYPQAPPPAVNHNHAYAMPPSYGHAMPPSYGHAMYPIPPGYPYNPTAGTYPINQPWHNHWQPPEAHPGTPHGFNAYGHPVIYHDSIAPSVNPLHKQRKVPVVIDLEAMENVKSPEILKFENPSEMSGLHYNGDVPHVKPFHKQRKVPVVLDLEAMENVKSPEIPKSENPFETPGPHHDSIAPHVKPFHKQRKVPVVLDLEAMENVKSPEIPKSENPFETPGPYHDSIAPHVKPFHKQRKVPVVIDLEAMENDTPLEEFENASKTSELYHDGIVPPVDAYARDELPSPAPVKILRSSTRAKAKTQTEISNSWLLRSNDKQSSPTKRPISASSGSNDKQCPPTKRPFSASFGTVETHKKSKPTKTKTKGSSRARRNGEPWLEEETKIAREAMCKGASVESIADMLERSPGAVYTKLWKAVAKIWVPRTTDVKLMRTLVIDKKIASFSKIHRHFPDVRNRDHLRPIFQKISNGCLLTNIPSEPDNFIARIQNIRNGEKFDKIDHREVVYPRGFSETFEYRWTDSQLIIIDTANFLINVNPILAWYPDINKTRFIKRNCYATVAKKTSKWFAGEWVSLLAGVRLYVLSGHWPDNLRDLVLLDKDGKHRQPYKDMVRGFEDDDSYIMCSLCDLAFTTQDSYQVHAGLHDQGWPHIRSCCLEVWTAPGFSPQEPHHCLHHKIAGIGPIQDLLERHVHGSFHRLMEFHDPLSQDNNIDHDWDLIAYSVRWSSSHPRIKSGQFDIDMEQLVEAYERSFEPKFKNVIKSPDSIRSSRCPIFTHSTKTVHKPSRSNEFFGQIYEMTKSSRILIMSQSIEGLTTNLQSLVFFARSMEHLRITLGFCLPRPTSLLNFGQVDRCGKGWVFYDLQTLRSNITGAATDPRYMRLVKALFFIQKYKQDHRLTANVHPKDFGGGQGRNDRTFSTAEVLAMLGGTDYDGQDSDDSSVEDGNIDDDSSSEEDEEYDTGTEVSSEL